MGTDGRRGSWGRLASGLAPSTAAVPLPLRDRCSVLFWSCLAPLLTFLTAPTHPTFPADVAGAASGSSDTLLTPSGTGTSGSGGSVARVFEILTRGESGLAQQFEAVMKQEVGGHLLWAHSGGAQPGCGLAVASCKPSVAWLVHGMYEVHKLRGCYAVSWPEVQLPLHKRMNCSFCARSN